MDPWIWEWESGKRYRIVNNTGEDVLNASFELGGAAVAGMWGSSTWSRSFPEVPAGEGPSEVFARAMGPDGFVQIRWESGDGESRSFRLDLP